MKIRASREMGSERDHWSGKCDEWPLENTQRVKGLSSGHISPVGVVWWLSGVRGIICSGRQSDEDQEKATDDRSGLTSSNAFPDIHPFSLLIPYAALCVEIPVNVNFPNPCSVADNSGHR